MDVPAKYTIPILIVASIPLLAVLGFLNMFTFLLLVVGGCWWFQSLRSGTGLSANNSSTANMTSAGVAGAVRNTDKDDWRIVSITFGE
jgi:hypothetical protein